MRLLLPLLSGCFVRTLTHTCERETFDVADDEVPGELVASAADVFSVVEGTFAFDAVYEATGAAVAGAFTVTRGDGPAVATDGTLVEHVARGAVGFGTRQLTWTPECEDTLEVPVDVVLATDDTQVVLSLPATAFARSTQVGQAPELYEVRGDAETVDAMPPPVEPDAVAGLALQWTADGAFASVSLWWDGADYVQVLETEYEAP